MTPDASGRYRFDRLDHDAAAHGHGRGASRGGARAAEHARLRTEGEVDEAAFDVPDKVLYSTRFQIGYTIVILRLLCHIYRTLLLRAL